MKNPKGGKMEQSTLEFFDQKIRACDLKRKQLQEEGYGDEANFEKIRANVYDIFRTVFQAGEKRFGKDRMKAEEFFLEELEQIPSGWAAAYEDARAHEDARAMHIEGIKLDVARKIREAADSGQILCRFKEEGK